MTLGGPLHATLSVVLYMFNEGFEWWHVGYAAAVALVLFALTLVGGLVQLRLQPGVREESA